MEKLSPDISKENPYWIDRERYYELKHFCSQYFTWKKKLDSINFYPSLGNEATQKDTSSPVEKVAEIRERYQRHISMLERAATSTDEVIGPYILVGVTSGLSYDIMNAQGRVPCSKDIYYDLYRKFFWILDGLRG